MKCAVLGDSQYVASQGTKIKVCQTCHFKALQTKCQTEALQRDKNLADSQKSCRQAKLLQTKLLHTEVMQNITILNSNFIHSSM